MIPREWGKVVLHDRLHSPLDRGKKEERKRENEKMAEGEGLEPSRPKPPVFKTGALPIMLTLLRLLEQAFIVPIPGHGCPDR